MIVLQEHCEATEVPGRAIEDVAAVFIYEAAHMSISLVRKLLVLRWKSFSEHLGE